uniref:Uncharacterized protein n=1 Tax=Anguilla anguilla TaxID=7936 RepID=A0A0E9TTQ8_ANGAN
MRGKRERRHREIKRKRVRDYKNFKENHKINTGYLWAHAQNREGFLA